MLEQDDRYGEESLGVGRGIVYGLVFGILLWAGIIGFVLMMLR